MPKPKKKAKKRKIKAVVPSKSEIETVVPPIPEEEYEPPSPKPLSEVPIYFWSNMEENQSPIVPPPTPIYVTNVVTVLNRIPAEFPPLTSFELPYVKEVGVKKCIEILGEFLGCRDFAFDYIQFWFLDMLTDCLWKTQDEYNLRDKEQKIVLEWVLYIFKVMTDPKSSYSRKTLFTIFKEAVLLAGDVVTEGVADVPLPHNLFALVSEEDEEEEEDETSEDTDESSASTISVSTFKSKNLIEMQFDGQTKEYVVSKGLEGYSSDSSTSSESLDDTTTDDTMSTESSEADAKLDSTIIQAEEEKAEVFEPVQYKDYKQFYQPDPNIPERFLPLPEEKKEYLSEESTSSESDDDDEQEEEEDEEECSEKSSYVTDFNYLERVPPIETCEEKALEGKQSFGTQATLRNDSIRWKKDQKLRVASSQIPGSIKANQKNVGDQQSPSMRNGSRSKKVWTNEDQNSVLSVQLTDSQILEKLAQYKLWEQRLNDMDDPRKGWVPIKENVEQLKPDNAKSEDLCADEDFIGLIPENEDFKQDNSKLISMGVLCAIIDLVFDYFYQSFHFTLIKLAMRAAPDTITQTLNTDWKVPKANKEELQKPKPPKKKKRKKSKKRKKKKKSKKSSKKSRKSGKSSKGKKGKGKKSKKSSDKKSKKSTGKKSKKGRKKKLTKEEKAELKRQRKLQEEMEEERRRLEENRRFLFPLKDAATDELFMDIFENWVKPVKKKEKKKKGKKGKKDKKEKKGKGKGKKKK